MKLARRAGGRGRRGERPGEQDDDAADHHHHVAGDGRLLEGELGAALVEHAEQERREDDADRMRSAHERDGDADEAVAGGEFEEQPVLVAHELVDRESAGERAGEDHGDDLDPGRRNARIDGAGRVGADDADGVAEAGAVDEEPDRVARRKRQHEVKLSCEGGIFMPKDASTVHERDASHGEIPGFPGSWSSARAARSRGGRRGARWRAS